jgi:hypothetical protein
MAPLDALVLLPPFQPGVSMSPQTLQRQSPKATFLQILPGEIRNEIFELCIGNALNNAKTPRFQTEAGKKGFTITALPQWNGPGCMRTEGIGPLPLLFVNRQIHKELSSLVYSKVEEISIGGYFLQFRNEDPSPRWDVAYSLLKQHPDLQKFTKNVKIILPHTRDDLLRYHWESLGYKYQRNSGRCQDWTILPGLEEFLCTFESLSTLKLVITSELREPPQFEQLLSLYDLCGDGTTVEILDPRFGDGRAIFGSPWAGRWTHSWNECLSKHGRA